MLEESAPSPPLSPEQTAAQEKLDGIMRDREHPYHRQGPRTEAAIQEVLNLRRQILATENKTLTAYRDPGEAPPANAPPPETLTITASDLPRLAPAEWTSGQTARVVAAADALGVGPYETVALFNLTASPPPPPERELDLDALWGDAADANIRTVNALLTKIRARDEDLHDRLVPYIQRSAPAAQHALAVARRLAGLPSAPRSAPGRATPPPEPADDAEDTWPFTRSDTVIRG